MQTPPTPSRAMPRRTLMAPVRRCSRTRSQRRQVRPLRLLRQAVQRVGSRDVSPAAAALPSFYWQFLPTHAPRHNRHLWTLRRMRTKARFPLRPSRTKPSRLEPHSHFPVGSRLGRFPLRPTHTRSPISKPRCRFCAPRHFPAFLSALPTSTTSRARAATEAPAALLAVPACLGLADLQARMAQLQAACAYSHAIRAAASMPRAVCRANKAPTPRRAPCQTTFHAAARVVACTAQVCRQDRRTDGAE